MLIFLRLGAKGVNNRSNHADAKGHDHWGTCKCHGVGIHLLFANTPARTAVLYGPIRCHPAALVHGLMPTCPQLSTDSKSELCPVDQFLRQILSDKGIDLLLKCGRLLWGLIFLGLILLGLISWDTAPSSLIFVDSCQFGYWGFSPFMVTRCI